MVTQPTTPANPYRPAPGVLADSLVALAGTPDDASQVRSCLVTIAQLTAERVAAASYASVTVLQGEAYTTVATSSEMAVAVDLAQYADDDGPCLRALETGVPVGVQHIATTMTWPGFRETAFKLGLRASLSVPLFAGSGAPIAALNIYGHDPDAMAPLTARVWSVYDPEQRPVADPGGQPLDPGGAELVSGLAGAFEVRARIQQAAGVVMAREHNTSREAYLTLRMRAAASGASLIDTAAAVLAEQVR